MLRSSASGVTPPVQCAPTHPGCAWPFLGLQHNAAQFHQWRYSPFAVRPHSPRVHMASLGSGAQCCTVPPVALLPLCSAPPLAQGAHGLPWVWSTILRSSASGVILPLQCAPTHPGCAWPPHLGWPHPLARPAARGCPASIATVTSAAPTHPGCTWPPLGRPHSPARPTARSRPPSICSACPSSGPGLG